MMRRAKQSILSSLLLLGGMASLTACSYVPDMPDMPQIFGSENKAGAEISGEETGDDTSNTEAPDADSAANSAINTAHENRYEVLLGSGTLSVSEEAQKVPAEIPTSRKNKTWLNRAVASRYGNIAIRGFYEVESVEVGDGESFLQGLAPTPVISTDQVIAMDGIGHISAHRFEDITDIQWLNSDGVEEDEEEILGGGLSIDGDVLFATTGFGRLLAIDRKTGKTIWKTSVGAPIRGAPDSAAGVVVVLTADNQTIAYNAKTGTPLWNHRGIQETTGFFSMTAPVITESQVMVAYSSGELFALRLQTGKPIWADAVSSTNRTSALSGFSGIDADPMVQDGVVYTIGEAGSMIASAALNGRPLWQQDIASLVTPWGVGNMIFVVTTRHELAGLLKRDGQVAFKKNLGQYEEGKDVTPKLFAPIMVAGSVCVLNENGRMRCIDPHNNRTKLDYDLVDDVATNPIVAQGYLFLITKDGRLYQYGK
jgi:outer membrane protein assembly factor BamB